MLPQPGLTEDRNRKAADKASSFAPESSLGSRGHVASSLSTFGTLGGLVYPLNLKKDFFSVVKDSCVYLVRHSASF